MVDKFVRQTRSITEWEYWNCPNDVAVLTHIGQRVGFKAHGYKGLSLAVGQCVIGRDELAKECGLSPQNVRTSIDHLVKSGVITIESTNRGTVVTLVKYYLFGKSYGRANQQTSHQLTNDQPLNNNVRMKKDDLYSDIPVV